MQSLFVLSLFLHLSVTLFAEYVPRMSEQYSAIARFLDLSEEAVKCLHEWISLVESAQENTEIAEGTLLTKEEDPKVLRELEGKGYLTEEAQGFKLNEPFLRNRLIAINIFANQHLRSEDEVPS